jgi:hypothetical protein
MRQLRKPGGLATALFVCSITLGCLLLWQSRLAVNRESLLREREVLQGKAPAVADNQVIANKIGGVAEPKSLAGEELSGSAARIRAPVGLENPSSKPEPGASDDLSREFLTAETLKRWEARIYADCHGQEIAHCESLANEFSRILQAQETLDDGWSDWMESQILQSLIDRRQENGLDKTGVKCDARGCVFFVAAKSVADLFGGPSNHDDFNRWLRSRAWNDELQSHNKLNGESSTLAWEVFGLRTEPVYIWYVVTRRY